MNASIKALLVESVKHFFVNCSPRHVSAIASYTDCSRQPIQWGLAEHLVFPSHRYSRFCRRFYTLPQIRSAVIMRVGTVEHLVQNQVG